MRSQALLELVQHGQVAAAFPGTRAVGRCGDDLLEPRAVEGRHDRGGGGALLRVGIPAGIAILERGDVVVMYLEGGRSRTGELGTARPGLGRLALETGVPVVPVAIFGSERTRNWRRLQFPKVTVRFGEPVRFDQIAEPDREQSQYASDQVFARVRELWEGLRAAGR